MVTSEQANKQAAELENVTKAIERLPAQIAAETDFSPIAALFDETRPALPAPVQPPVLIMDPDQGLRLDTSDVVLETQVLVSRRLETHFLSLGLGLGLEPFKSWSWSRLGSKSWVQDQYTIRIVVQLNRVKKRLVQWSLSTAPKLYWNARCEF